MTWGQKGGNQHVHERMNAVKDELWAAHQASKSLSSATKGRERDEVVHKYLEKVLPPIYRFGTGDITDTHGRRSGQLDVVIEYGFAPSLPIAGGATTRLYLAEGVAAAIEVKSDMAGQWSEVENTARQLSALHQTPVASLTIGNRAQTRVPFFVVGFRGWSDLETLKRKVAASASVDAALIIESGNFASKDQSWATGGWGLWMLIATLQFLASSVIGGRVDLMRYATEVL
jgi:hypothetical protein